MRNKYCVKIELSTIKPDEKLLSFLKLLFPPPKLSLKLLPPPKLLPRLVFRHGASLLLFPALLLLLFDCDHGESGYGRSEKIMIRILEIFRIHTSLPLKLVRVLRWPRPIRSLLKPPPKPLPPLFPPPLFPRALLKMVERRHSETELRKISMYLRNDNNQISQRYLKSKNEEFATQSLRNISCQTGWEKSSTLLVHSDKMVICRKVPKKITHSGHLRGLNGYEFRNQYNLNSVWFEQ